MGNGKQGQHGAHKVLKHMKGYMMLHDMPIVTDEKFGADVHSPVKSHIKGHADPPKKNLQIHLHLHRKNLVLIMIQINK